MRYTDYLLKFNSEGAAKAVLFESEAKRFRNTDVIGVIYKPTGAMLQGDDGEYPEMAPLDGWHVNVRLCDDEDGSALEAYRVHPENPVRKWA